MPRRRHKPEEIVAKLRQVEVLAAQGTPVAEAIRSIGVTEVMYYRWQSEYGGLKGNQVKRQIEHGAPQPGVLAFEILETLRLVELQTAVLAAPAVIALFRDPKRSADPSDRLAPAQPNLSLPKQGNDLLRRVSLPYHILVSSSEFGNIRIRSINMDPF